MGRLSWLNTSCYTLEDAARAQGVKVPGATCIPEGRFRVIVDESQAFGRPMLHILGVPKFDGVRMHGGNDEDDTEGCPLVGRRRAGNRIWDCKPALEALQRDVEAALARSEEVWLTVRNLPS